jgi:phospholipid N-methyltransferase
MTIVLQEQAVPLDFNQWRNADNKEFYEKMPVSVLQESARATGMALNKDLHCLLPYIKNAESILEVGAGYGRVIDFILQEHPGSHITAIERCPQFFDFLSQEYRDPDVNLIYGDISSYAFKKKFDVVLWLWAGMLEFSQKEQARELNKCAGAIHRNGKIVVDAICFEKPLRHPLDEVFSDGRNYFAKKRNTFLYGYGANDADIDKACQSADLFVENIFMYVSNGFFSKKMYVLSHSC